MTVDLAVTNGTLVTPDGMVDADLLVDGEQIAGLVAPGTAEDAETVVDADGSLVMPGIVDPHVHIAQESPTDTYRTGSEAAALGGVTSFITFAPQPPEGSATLHEAVERQYEQGESSLVDFALHPIISREDPALIDELADLVDMGVVSYKMFTAYEIGIGNGFIEQVFAELADLDAVAVLHTEDEDVCSTREAEMRRTGRGAATDYPDSRPPHAEAMAADDAVQMALDTGVNYYGIHTTCRAAADVIDRGQTDKSQIRGETCVHYTTLDRSEYERQGNLPVIAPPLRSQDDIEAMFEYLADGTLGVVSTDHVTYTRESKSTENWWDAGFGANSVQRSLPVFHDEAVVSRGFSYPKLVRLMATNPAETFGLPEKGTLEPGTDADFVIFDPEATQTIRAEDNASNADFSVYEGRDVTGRVEETYLRGECVASGGEVVGDPGYGEPVSRAVPDWEQ